MLALVTLGITEAVRCTRSILGQPAFAALNGGELSPGPQVQTNAQVLEWVARDAETALHPAGTCKLGVDALAVVAPDSLRVHGVDGLCAHPPKSSLRSKPVG